MSIYEEDHNFVNHPLRKMSPEAKRYRKGAIVVIYSPNEPMDDPNFINGTNGEHLSISHPHRYPTWQEIKDARYHFMSPDNHVYMILPPKDQYVNVHPNCFHLWGPSKRRITVIKEER